jgi:Trk K+ transport system NAD-binding subunit
MGDILFLFVRRLRAPLITVILVYAISVLGLTLIPGKDGNGNVVAMGFFHAFYVMSYTATTIGFGEIPYAFTDAQRLWVTICIYFSVIGWAYTFGSVLAIANDPTFQSMLARSLFMWRVKGMREPFYIVCGYGQSGAAIAKALDRVGARLVVIENRAERAALVAVEPFENPPLVLCADARIASALEDAGIQRPECRALLALAGDDAVNQAIAIGAKVLSPELLTVARTKAPVAKANLQAFGGITVINPFETFATNLALDLQAPAVLQLEEWLTAANGTECPPSIDLPRGNWVLVGYGRFGQAIGHILDAAGIGWKTFDPKIYLEHEARLLHGEYTEQLLIEAGIQEADVLVAGTDVDAVNLGVITLARRVNPDIFVVIRQNHVHDSMLVDAAKAQVKFVQAELMLHECLQILNTPMLARLITHIRVHHSALANPVLQTILARLGSQSPQAWEFDCDLLQPGLFSAFFQNPGHPPLLEHLCVDPQFGGGALAALPIALERQGLLTVLPQAGTLLLAGDKLLFVGDLRAMQVQQRFAAESGLLAAICSGQEPPRSSVFRWLAKRGWYQVARR